MTTFARTEFARPDFDVDVAEPSTPTVPSPSRAPGRATLTPLGGSPYNVATTAETWQETERGGLASLKFDAPDLTPNQIAELVYQSAVQFSVPGRSPLLARVLRTSGTCTVECEGYQAVFDEVVGGVTYSDTNLANWTPRYLSASNATMDVPLHAARLISSISRPV